MERADVFDPHENSDVIASSSRQKEINALQSQIAVLADITWFKQTSRVVWYKCG